MNNVTMETVASLHSPYGRVKVKPFNFSWEVQSMYLCTANPEYD